MPPDDVIADPQAVIAALRAERDAALAREAALSEVLAVINRSPGDPGPVFEAILQKAHSLCGAAIGSLQTYDGTHLHTAAAHGYPPDHFANSGLPFRPTAANSQRLIDGARLVHYADIAAMPEEIAGNFRHVVELGVRTILLIPLRKDGTYVGGISALRTEVKPFTEAEISLLESFAAQAVIAIENARLIAEQREALEQQTATAEVLQVINTSPGDLTPVFDAMLKKAMRLCGAAFGVLRSFDGEHLRMLASRGVPTEYAEFLARNAGNLPAGAAPAPGTRAMQALQTGQPAQRLDARESAGYKIGNPGGRAIADLGGARTVLHVPLVKDRVSIGLLTFYRREVRSFSDKQIALLQNFAAQAVVATENARLLNEQGEALEQQTATAEVLQVINANPGNLTAVFDIILEKAVRLCGVTFGVLDTWDGAALHTVATYGLPPAFAAYRAEKKVRRWLPPIVQRLVDTQRTIHIPDSMLGEGYLAGHPDPRALVDLGGARTTLLIPLVRDNRFLGYVSLYRQEVRPFTVRQITLLENFAAQAVIAMENARLLNQQREALEQQTATAEVLQVINSSPGDLAPVFDAILLRAHDLCEASFGALMTYDGERFRAVAHHGTPAPFREFLAAGICPRPGDPFGRMVEGAVLSHTHDMSDVATRYPDHPLPRAAVDLGGIRTLLVVPLRKDDTLLGAIAAYRQEVRPFSEKQIALLQNFAAQAVIAMENARLLNEQREALEQQTATAEVLQVINASPGDLAPVFQAILEKAMRLCQAAFGGLFTYDGERFHTVAGLGTPAGLTEFRTKHPPSPVPGSTAARLLETLRSHHILDRAQEPDYLAGEPGARAMVELGGARSMLNVPLLKEDRLLGFISIYRQEVRPFSDKQISLLESFADQAVIAIENTRLITEQREALERQTAMAEVLRIISTSPGNLAPVFEAILDAVLRLSDSALGSLWTYDGELMHVGAIHGYERTHEPFRPEPGSMVYRVLHSDEDIAWMLDIRNGETYQAGVLLTVRAADVYGVRTQLIAALRKDGKTLGVINIFRREVKPFTDAQVALVKAFAAQAVIAMENARLLAEQQEALERQTAIGELLSTINASPGHLAPVFDMILEMAHRICGAAVGMLAIFEGGQYQAVATHGYPAQFASRVSCPVHPYAPQQALLRGDRLYHVPDALAVEWGRDDQLLREFIDLTGVRTYLLVPLRKDGNLLGFIGAHRLEVRPFSDTEVALLENFAAQAVIAMENARLLTETREALEQQTATAEVLQVINSSPGDVTPVLDAILEKAHALCGAATGMLLLYDGALFHAVATRGYSEDYAALLREPFPPGAGHQALIQGDRLFHVPDMQSVTQSVLLPSIEARLRLFIELGLRTGLLIPLRKDGVLLGIISAARLEVRPFSDKEIALLENFAAQAVIAMENARLLSEIRQRQEELRVTFEHMGDGVAMFDETRRLVAWNGKFQEIFDLPDVLLGKRCTYEEYLQFLARRGDFGAGIDTVEQIHELVASTGQPYGYERTRPDGRVIEIRRNPVPDGGFVLIYSDITERKRSEAEIRAARDAAEAAYRDLKAAQANLIQAEKMASLGQLTAGIAHEIKNPLNFVNNFASLSVDLLDELKATAAPGFATLDADRHAEIDELTRTLASNLEKINEHGRRADGIVRSMLDHSRGSSGERRSVDLNVLVDEALNLAYHGARAQDQSFNITLQRNLGVGIAPIRLAPQDITRVLLNLFGNGFYAARKRQQAEAAPDFEPTLKVTTRELGDAVEIRVRDNGIGIPTEIKDKLFQPFFSTKPTGEGTGLGLSISYDIVVQQHGGTISVDSKVDEYSEFTVMLPRSR